MDMTAGTDHKCEVREATMIVFRHYLRESGKGRMPWSVYRIPAVRAVPVGHALNDESHGTGKRRGRYQGRSRGTGGSCLWGSFGCSPRLARNLGDLAGLTLHQCGRNEEENARAWLMCRGDILNKESERNR